MGLRPSFKHGRMARGAHAATPVPRPRAAAPPPADTGSTAPDASASARALARALRERGLRRVYGVADARVSVVSTPQATVWCRGGVLSWRDGLGRRVQILAEEIETAVGLLLEQAAAS